MTDLITARRGPLAGLRVVEFAGIGPGPFACMLLSDMGADVVTVERGNMRDADKTDIVGRGRNRIFADLKDADEREEILVLLEKADVLVEGFRPGVMERLGLGPDIVQARNRHLVYARMTGWGQSGPLATVAGHDINYIAITGALHAIGPKNGAPVPPLNLVGDYGGGSLYLVVGILAALHESKTSGMGQVVDAAIIDGVTSMMSLFVSSMLRDRMTDERGTNILDGGAPFYRTYETKDGKYIAIGSIEPHFFEELCDLIGLCPSMRGVHNDKSRWAELVRELSSIFLGRTQAEWTSILEGSDACFAPVLSLADVASHKHNVARGAFINIDGIPHPAPAPRFSRTPSAIRNPVSAQTEQIEDLLVRWSK